MKSRYLIIFLILISCLRGIGQRKVVDSLLHAMKREKEDTGKVNAMNKLSTAIEKIGNYDSSFLYAERADSLAEKLNFQKGIIYSYINLGIFYNDRANYIKAMDYDLKSLNISEKLGYKKEIGEAITSIGIVYFNLGDYSKSLECDLKALTIAQEIGDNDISSANLCNLGNIYDNEGNYSKALEYMSNALVIDTKKGDKNGMAVDLGNIGGIYNELGNYSKALEYDLKALKITQEIGDKDGISSNLQSIGYLYEKLPDYPKALQFYFRALAIVREIGDKSNTALYMGNIGYVYTMQKNYPRAKGYLDSSLSIAKSIKEKEDIKVAYADLAILDSATGNYKAIYEDYKEYIVYRDSLLNDANTKKMLQAQMNFDFKRKTDSVKADQDRLNVISERKSQQQKMLLNSFIGGFTLMLALALFIFIGYRQKQKANMDISHQKELVEGKNKEILDSITYAKRLQEAILPPIGLIKKVFPESFVLYKPKDIVAGDFYWMERAGDNILIAAADCTGHGVPGALVSVICSNALNRTVKEFHITEPGKILDKVTELVLETFEKSESDVQDGMDISLCCINTKTNEILWSGAYNPLWYVQQGEMHEVEADKQPIGKQDNLQPFHTHTVKLKKGDFLYLFTDGYADQFGGPKGKKFKYKQLYEVLLASTSNSMDEQKTILEGHLDDWKGELEQVDDILVIGIRV